MNALKSLREGLITSGGATIDPSTGEQPTTGYVVSVPGAEARTNDIPSDLEFAAWYIGRAEAILRKYAAKGLRAFLGAWQDGKHSYLDVSVIVPDRATAMNLGREYGQVAIFDLGAKAEIRLA